MTDFLLFLLLVEVALLIIWGFRRPSRVYQFPFLAGCVFGLWAWPQFYGLQCSGTVPDEMLDKALLMSILCGGMCFAGYRVGHRPIRGLNWTLDRRRLCYAATVLTLIGVFFQYKLSRIPDKGSQWSGLPVIYAFFAKLLSYGFGMGILLVLRRLTFSALLPVAIGGLGYFDWIVFAGRRVAIIQFVLIIGMLMWFIRKKVPPRLVVACVILAGAILSYNIGIYRSAMSHVSLFNNARAIDISGLNQMSVTDPLKRVTSEGGSEMRNSAYYIAATEKLGAYDFGLYQWSVLVWEYFPAQIFGSAAKQNFMSFGGLLEIGRNAERAYGYQSGTGTTTGGMTDAFASFWYFGCLEFFAIAYLMRRLYEAAIRGSPVWQLACALLTVYALHAITHSTAWFVSPWVSLVIFVVPTLVYARARPGDGKREVIGAMQVATEIRSRANSKLATWCDKESYRGKLKFAVRLPQPGTKYGNFVSRFGAKQFGRPRLMARRTRNIVP